eukprot:COSAG06_NODE_2783_length_6290_cov_3.541916_6_plen_185_part_00
MQRTFCQKRFSDGPRDETVLILVNIVDRCVDKTPILARCVTATAAAAAAACKPNQITSATALLLIDRRNATNTRSTSGSGSTYDSGCGCGGSGGSGLLGVGCIARMAVERRHVGSVFAQLVHEIAKDMHRYPLNSTAATAMTTVFRVDRSLAVVFQEEIEGYVQRFLARFLKGGRPGVKAAFVV